MFLLLSMMRLREMQSIYATLLHNVAEFQGFVEFVGAKADDKVRIAELVREEFKGKICDHADVAGIIAQQPTELAFALALIDTTDYRSVTPSWVLSNFPKRCKQTLFHGMKEGTRYHLPLSDSSLPGVPKMLQKKKKSTQYCCWIYI